MGYGIPNGLRTAEALEFIRSEVANARPFPTPKELADHMGWRQETSARDCLMRLIMQGHVIRRTISETKSRRRYHYELAP